MRGKQADELLANQLEALVRHQRFSLPGSTPIGLAAELRLAYELAGLDLGVESSVQGKLRARLALLGGARKGGSVAHAAPPSAARRTVRWRLLQRPISAGAAIMLLALIIVRSYAVAVVGLYLGV